VYHIHDQPVPANGNCTATLAHQDPFVRGEDTPCDAAKPATCQVGDLSGKYGKPNGTTFSASYNDAYAALVPGLGAFFGNRSIVVHFANKTRISCANFVPISAAPSTAASCSVDSSALASGGSSGSSSNTTGLNLPSAPPSQSATASGQPGGASSTRPPVSQATTAGASVNIVNSVLLLGGVAGAALLL